MLPPLPSVATISAEIRLAYVLRHFQLAYEAVPDVSIGYADMQPQIEVQAAAGSFFAEANPYPAEPTWREWAGRSVPFFFDPSPELPLLELLPGGRVRIQADIISAAFYLLSGWQEFFSAERDPHGRFPYAASVQHRYGFVSVPIVNYYFDVLRAAVEHVTGRPLQPRRWAGGAAWAAFITHDIDNLYSAWKAPAKAALHRRDWPGLAKQLWQRLTQPDAWDNLTLVQQTVAEFGAKSTFFFLPEHRKAPNGTPNADYRIQQLQTALQAVAAAGAEIGLHASYQAGTNPQPQDLHAEAARVADGAAGLGLRFHYLSTLR